MRLSYGLLFMLQMILGQNFNLMDLYSPAAKQVTASNQRTDSFTSLGLVCMPCGYLGVAPPLAPRLFLPRIMISGNNYRGIPPRYKEAVIIAVRHDGDCYAQLR